MLGSSSNRAPVTLRYHQIALLGEGSMGAVYRVHDRLTRQDVALKSVALTATTETDLEELRLALAHEFRILASLRHPHIISVFDYGFDSERQPFFTMELLDAAQTILDIGRHQTLSQQIELVMQALEALAYLHRRGVLHHDLKPENMVVANGELRLLDFGLAVLDTQPRDNDSFGTLLYMAPEILRGQPYTEASDLYSLGVVAYELLTNQHPFPATSARSFVSQVLTNAPDLTAIVGPPTLATVIGQLLAKNPADRPATAYAALVALREATGIMIEASSGIRESYLQAATFVGRETEMALLTEALSDAHHGHGSAWLIAGESGVGKSRLLREFETHALVDGFVVIRGQAVQEGGAAFQLWRNALRQLVVTSTQVDDLTAGVLLPFLPDIGELLDRPVMPAPILEGTATQIRLFSSIANLFLHHPRPLLLLLEDLQWAEDDLLPLPYLLSACTQQSLMVIGSYRDDEKPHFDQRLPDMKVLKLGRLNAEQVASLSAAMLGEEGQQPELLERLQQETEGNTFFLVETVRALAEEIGDLTKISHTSLPRRLLSGGVQQLVRRQLERLPAWAQPTLEIAAIIGRHVDTALLQDIVPHFDIATWLRACNDAAILELAGERWQFRHDKLRSEVLAERDPDNLRHLHAVVAEALEQRYGFDDGYAGQFAYHWGHAGNSIREASASLRAGRYARQQNRIVEAASLLARALELTPATDQQAQIAIHLQYGEVRIVLGEWDAAESHFHTVLALANRAATADAQLALGQLCQLRSAYPEALRWLEQAASSAHSLGDRLRIARTLVAEGDVWSRQAQYDQARRCIEAGLAHQRAVDDQAGIANALHSLGQVAFHQGDYAQARTWYSEGLSLYRSLGDIQGTAICLSSLGLTAINQGDNTAAQEILEESLALQRTIGYKDGVSTALTNLGNAAANQGDYATARSRYLESLAIARELGNGNNIAILLNNLGSLASEEGDYPTARTLLEESLALRRERHEHYGVVSSLNNLGFVAVGQGDYPAAYAHYTESLTLGLAIGDKSSIPYNLAGLANLAILLGNPAHTVGLAAATDAVLRAIGGTLAPEVQRLLNTDVARARIQLDEAAFELAWAAGMHLGPAEAVEYALSSPPPITAG